MSFKVDGDGYFVFENLNCMLKGVHIKNSFDKNMNFDDKQNNDNCSKLIRLENFDSI